MDEFYNFSITVDTANWMVKIDANPGVFKFKFKFGHL